MVQTLEMADSGAEQQCEFASWQAFLKTRKQKKEKSLGAKSGEKGESGKV